MSDIYIREHKSDSAWYYARHVMQVAPDQRLGYVQISSLFVLEGQPDSAIHWCEKMMSHDPSPVTRILGLRQIASIHKSWGRFGKSQDYYRMAEQIADSARLRPLKSGIQQSLGALYFDTERFGEAISHYHEAAALDSLNPEAALSEARIQAQQGNRDAARAITLRLEERWKGKVDSTLPLSGALEIRGYLALAAKDYQGAIDNITAARRLLHDTTICRIQLAEAYIGSGKYDEAIAELTQLRQDAEVDWPSGQYLHGLYLLADAQVKAGRPHEAIEPLQRFLVFWGNADWELPIVKEAKRLFGSLSAQ